MDPMKTKRKIKNESKKNKRNSLEDICKEICDSKDDIIETIDKEIKILETDIENIKKMKEESEICNKKEKDEEENINKLSDDEKSSKLSKFTNLINQSLLKEREIVKEDEEVEILFKKVKPNYPQEGVFDFEKMEDNLKEYLIPTNRPVRIYCDGVYDMFHYGHARYLQQAKNLFDNVYLIAGVSSDSETRKLKGDTVFNEFERAESLRPCRYVDEIIEAPWIITEDFIEKHKIDYVCHDTHSDLYKEIEKIGKFIPTKRTNGISTTKIITRIIRDYDDFVKRNFERGVSLKELNLSFLKKSKYNILKKKKEIQEEIRNEIEDIKEEFLLSLDFWERKRNDFFQKFMEKFTTNVNKIKDFYKKRLQNESK